MDQNSPQGKPAQAMRERLPNRRAAVVHLHIPHILPEPDAPGWLVVYRSYGWAFGSRREALAAWRDLARQVR
jgi:hypothetical protein